MEKDLISFYILSVSAFIRVGVAGFPVLHIAATGRLQWLPQEVHGPHPGGIVHLRGEYPRKFRVRVLGPHQGAVAPPLSQDPFHVPLLQCARLVPVRGLLHFAVAVRLLIHRPHLSVTENLNLAGIAGVHLHVAVGVHLTLGLVTAH